MYLANIMDVNSTFEYHLPKLFLYKKALAHSNLKNKLSKNVGALFLLYYHIIIVCVFIRYNSFINFTSIATCFNPK